MKEQKGNIKIQRAKRPYKNEDLNYLENLLTDKYALATKKEQNKIKRLLIAIDILKY